MSWIIGWILAARKLDEQWLSRDQTIAHKTRSKQVRDQFENQEVRFHCPGVFITSGVRLKSKALACSNASTTAGSAVVASSSSMRPRC